MTFILQSLDGKFVTRRAKDNANKFSLFNVITINHYYMDHVLQTYYNLHLKNVVNINNNTYLVF